MTFRLFSFRAAALVASACVAGCGQGIPFAEVEGVITCGGRPLPNVEVVFLPDPEQGTSGPRSGGYTDDAGRYRLTAPGSTGAVTGTHRVTVRDLTAVRGPVTTKGAATVPKARFAEAYQSPSATPLRTVEVHSGKNTLNFDLPGPSR